MIEAKHSRVSSAETAVVEAPLGSAVIKEAERWMAAQRDFFSSMEAMMTDWAQRQRSAFDASSRSIQKICESRTIVDLVQAQHEWVSQCLQWTASEVRAVGDEAVAMTRKAAERVGEAVGERRDEMRQQSKAPATAEAKVPIERAAAE
jgi:hypothetical protein